MRAPVSPGATSCAVVRRRCGQSRSPRSAPAPVGARSGPFDLLLRGGTLVDGTGANPASSADLGLRGDRIVAIGDLRTATSAARVLDVPGLIVAPGFVDAHAHTDLRRNAKRAQQAPPGRHHRRLRPRRRLGVPRTRGPDDAGRPPLRRPDFAAGRRMHGPIAIDIGSLRRPRHGAPPGARAGRAREATAERTAAHAGPVSPRPSTRAHSACRRGSSTSPATWRRPTNWWRTVRGRGPLSAAALRHAHPQRGRQGAWKRSTRRSPSRAARARRC
jgi:hypothetical protein